LTKKALIKSIPKDQKQNSYSNSELVIANTLATPEKKPSLFGAGMFHNHP
jgi:hypothetical protein